MKKKVLIIILVVVLVVLLFYILNFVRNVKVIREYSSKLEEYQKLTNFYSKTIYTNIDRNNDCSTNEVWKKDNIIISKETLSDGSIRANYFNKDEKLMLMDMGEAKKGFKNVEYTEDFGNMAVLEDAKYYIEDNLWKDIEAAFTTKISNETIDGKGYYKFYMSDDFYFIVDKENMLKIKEINGNKSIELVDYSIETVTDEDVKMPSIEDYDFQEN